MDVVYKVRCWSSIILKHSTATDIINIQNGRGAAEYVWKMRVLDT